MSSLFHEDAEGGEDGGEDSSAEGTRSESLRCTPERLLEFIARTRRLHKRSPTLKECKEEFGGILGALRDSWILRDRGLI